ncbi:MAG: hypothetical protein AAFW00_12465 [Bacteroidota bacterium]
MTNTKNLFSILFLVTASFLLSCGDRSGGQNSDSNTLSLKETEVHFTTFPKESKINLPEEGFDFIGKASKLLATKDYLLVLDTYNAPHLTVLRKDNLSVIGKMISEGKGPGEALNPGKIIGLEGSNTFWLFDGLMQRFQLFDIEEA